MKYLAARVVLLGLRYWGTLGLDMDHMDYSVRISIEAGGEGACTSEHLHKCNSAILSTKARLPTQSTPSLTLLGVAALDVLHGSRNHGSPKVYGMCLTSLIQTRSMIM